MKTPNTLLEHILEMDKYFQSMNQIPMEANFKASIPIKEWKALKEAAISELGPIGEWIPPAPVLFPFDKKSNPDKFATYTIGQLWNAYFAGRKSGIQAQCMVPPSGWVCTRGPGHEGPCAAWPFVKP